MTQAGKTHGGAWEAGSFAVPTSPRILAGRGGEGSRPTWAKGCHSRRHPQTAIPRRPAFFSQILTKTGELSRQPTTHPEETEEELTEQQEALLGEGALTMPREGSTESESTQEDLEEEEDEEEDEEDCIQVKDEDGESGPDEGADLEESSAGYKKVPPTYRLSSFSDLHS